MYMYSMMLFCHLVIVEPVESSPTPSPSTTISSHASSSQYYSDTPTPTVIANSGVVVTLIGINASTVSDRL